MDFVKVDNLSDITKAGSYEWRNYRFHLEHHAEEFSGLQGWNLTSYSGRNAHRTEIYCGVNGGGIVYQCKKLKTILNHVKNLSTFYLS